MLMSTRMLVMLTMMTIIMVRIMDDAEDGKQQQRYTMRIYLHSNLNHTVHQPATGIGYSLRESRPTLK